MIFYFHPSTTSATLYLQDGADPSRRLRPRRRGQCRLQRAGEEGRRAVQAGQFEAAGRAGNRQAQDRRGRCVADRARRPTSSRPKPRCRKPKRPSAGQGRTGRQERAAAAQSRHRAAARHREAAGARRSAAGRRRCCDRRKQSASLRVSTLLPAEKASAEARWRRRRSISTRPSFAPASTGASSSSCFVSATSSIR